MPNPPVIWQPTQAQTSALVSTQFEILYGGARGGGKTDTGLAWPLYWIKNPKFRALIIRLNAKDLSDWIDRARAMYAGTRAVFTGNPTQITFPSGAIIRTGHLKDENAYGQYQGHEYQKMVIEELTQIPEERNYEKLISSCRSTVEGITPQVFNTTNPGNAGHYWVKNRWGIVSPVTGPIVQDTPLGGRIFIPAKVTDNPHLMEKDPAYVHRLEAIQDTSLRKAWLEGSWDDPTYDGAVYQNEMKALGEEGRVANFPYDRRYPVYTWWDLGIADSTAIGFFQHIGGQWRLIDGVEDTGKSLLHYIQLINSKGYSYGKHFGPHDLEQRDWSSGETRKKIAEQHGLNFEIVPKMSLADGINATRMKLPLLWVDKKQERFLRAVNHYHYEFDEHRGQYKNTPLHDWSSHWADMLRYWAITPDPIPGNQQDEEFDLYANSYS